MPEYTFRLDEFGTNFATRDRAKQLACDLTALLQARQAETLDIDFTGVMAISYSFADEFVRQLLSLSRTKSLKATRIIGVRDNLRPYLEQAMERRPEQSKVLVG